MNMNILSKIGDHDVLCLMSESVGANKDGYTVENIGYQGTIHHDHQS